ncbi:hypothetical protein ASC64_08535 [Nocardioides sp. Root122]|uniref:hypothetical protein n=1 Tax=Nocardioides TaxID=1839 RepID=UPI0007026BD3|nr:MULTISPECIES: hypothetical protein [Nocardioides]KQV69849.1 hypothetical protein ASC64_08535 [Nocardioides sp. Root122]MCK9822929.1 hypothetical protein [Nocardioides cavernae]
MTGLLTDLMRERADHLDAPELDLAAITRDGDRVVRRRRTAVVGGVAAASVLVVVAGAAVLGGRASDDAVVAAGPVAELDQLSWTTGRVLHTGSGATVALDTDVRAWVWVGDSVVYTDPSGRVHLWQGGMERIIGSAVAEGDLAELVTDATFVAWVDADRRLVRYDVTDGTLVRGPSMPGSRLRATAIDGATVYAADSEGVYAWQPSDPDAYRALGTDPRAVVLDAENGTLVRTAPGRTVVFERDGDTLLVAAREFAELSPDARLLSVEDDDAGLVVDTASGVEVSLDTGHEWAIGYRWMDATTVATLAFDGVGGEDMDGWLLACDAVTGACSRGEQLPALGGFQLPIGIHFAAD